MAQFLMLDANNQGLNVTTGDTGDYEITNDVNLALILEQPRNFILNEGILQYTPTFQPSSYHILVDGIWVLNNALLAQCRKDMWLKIKAYRDIREEMGVSVPISGEYYWFHTDVKSLVKYLFLLFLSTVFSSYFPQALSWKTMDGRLVTLSTGIIIQVFFITLNNGSTMFEVARQHKVNMEASQDPLGYDYFTGWPPVYEGELT